MSKEEKAIKTKSTLSVLTGLDKSSEEYKNLFKAMCLNCTNCTLMVTDSDVDDFRCFDKNVIDSYTKKILSTMPEDVDVKTLVIDSIKLKDPTKKCKNHVVNLKLIESEVSEVFGVPSTENK